MDLNPIVRIELIQAARRRRHFAMRAALALVLLYITCILMDTAWGQAKGHVHSRERAILPQHVVPLADLTFLSLTWLQGLAVILLVPGLVAGSIGEEDRRGTMIDLLATPLSSGAIILGKMTARLVYVGMAVAVGLPVVLPLALLGLLDPQVVAYAYAMLLLLTLFVGSLSILVSVIVRRLRMAIVVAYLLVGGWLLLPIYFSPILRATWPLSWLRMVNDWILQGHPFEATMQLFWIASAAIFNPRNVALARAGFLKALPRFVGFQGACSILLLLLAAFCLRPLRLDQWRRRSSAPSAVAHPAIGDDPMQWKERYARTHQSGGKAARLGAIALVVALFCPLVEPAFAAFQEWRASWSARQPSQDWHRGGLNTDLRQLSAGLYTLGLMAIAVIAATSITGERERGTWASLRTTLITGREIVRAKVSGTLWAMRGLSIAFATVWAIGLVTGSIHPLAVLAAAASLIVFASYAASLGVLCSTLCRTSDRAVAAALLAVMASNLFALLFVPLDLLGPLAGTRATLYLAGLTPLVQWVALPSPMEIQAWFAGRASEGKLALPWQFWGTWMKLDRGLIWIYLLSVTLHAIGAVALIRIAAWLLDAEAGQERWRLMLMRSARTRRTPAPPALEVEQ